MTKTQSPPKQLTPKQIKTKNKNGRPSKKGTIDLVQMKKLYLAGWTDKQVANFFGIARQTIDNWRKKNQKFLDTLKDAKAEADQKVEGSLYKRAMGFEYDEITYEKSKTGGLGVTVSKKEGKEAEIKNIKHTPTCKTKVVTKLIIPDTTAQIFWLKNRQPAKWRDKHDVELGKDTLAALFGGIGD